MKIHLLIFCLFYIGFSNAQKEKKDDLKFIDGIFNGSIELSTKISDKWSLETGLDASYNSEANSLQVPFHFRYKINKKLSVFTGPEIYYSSNTDFYLPKSSVFGTSAQLGIQYNFTENAYAKLFYLYNFTTKNNTNLGLLNNKSVLNFKIGYKF